MAVTTTARTQHARRVLLSAAASLRSNSSASACSSNAASRRAASLWSIGHPSNARSAPHRHDDLAEMPVRAHVVERRRRLVQREDAIDGKAKLAAGERVAEVLAAATDDFAHLLDRACAERDADIRHALQRVQIEVELALEAAEAPDIDDPPADRGSPQILVGDARRDLIDDEVDAVPAGRLEHPVRPGRIAGIEGEIRAELGKTRPPRGISRGPDDEPGTLQPGDLERHEADAGAGALDEDALSGTKAAIGDDGVMHRLERHGKRRRLLEAADGGR